jgi:uncharacterized protein YdbL (DUF1318 family)
MIVQNKSGRFKRKRAIHIIALTTCFIFSSLYVFAGGEKERMLSRLPVINQMKAEGIVGENNKGYLRFLGNQRVNEDVINAENTDRRTVYMNIAQNNGVSLEVVEKRRVLQISDRAQSGTWLQRDNGSWYRK